MHGSLCKEGLRECETGFVSISAGGTLPIDTAQLGKQYSHRMLSEQKTTGIRNRLLNLPAFSWAPVKLTQEKVFPLVQSKSLKLFKMWNYSRGPCVL